ncbi:hypothetical protein KIN20_004895 [Parelaphostrongylus tenuis]|uniref:ARF7 effector protein C-terminal domain-containing protein n=1 Tax=Parelaphostrongylus tenuis TaxID=148309 RepID=A0AAD5QI94_PARTN|nr:hypothetical protein KIN20_004895 [Parelaphostrongylus tenuis]
MSSTNDALSVLVGLTSSKSTSSTTSTTDKNDSFDSRQDSFDSTANLVFFDESYEDQLTQDELNRQRQMQRELGRLQFINPGGLMVQPTNNRRSRRKLVEDKETVQEKRHVFHDKKGKLIIPGEESITLCDCLLPECHGCHWPCASCGSRLCGALCQQNRKKFVACVKVLGVTPEVVTNNPYISNKS